MAGKNIVVVSAHPDDETLGVGGTLLKHRNNKDKLYWIIVTAISGTDHRADTDRALREKEIKKVSEAYGFSGIFEFGIDNSTLNSSSLPGLVKAVSEVFSKTKPEIIYCVNKSDAHSDHRVVYEAVLACTKSFRYPTIKQVLMYECISETEFSAAISENAFIPNYLVDISENFEAKLDVMRIYASELGEHPFPRSLENIRALATFRGAMAGVKYAEAFQLLKYIDK